MLQIDFDLIGATLSIYIISKSRHLSVVLDFSFVS